MINKETEQAVKVANLLKDLFTELSTVCGYFADYQLGKNSTPQVAVAEKVDVVKEVAPKNVEELEVAEQNVEEVEEAEESLEEQLQSLSMKDLKELAKSKGLKLGGKKEDLIARILEEDEEAELEEEEIEEEEELSDDEETTEDGSDEEADEDDEDEEEIDEEEEDNLAERVAQELEQYSDDEIREILEGVELSTKGKRQALISRVVEAVENGLLDFDNEEDEVPTTDYEGEEEEFVDEEDMDEDVEDDEEEDEEDEELSEREEIQAQIKEKIQSDYSKKKLTDKEIANFLETHFNGRFQAKDKKRALAKYMEIQAELVDDEGEVHEMGDPYYIDETPYCCGSELEELDNGNLYCEHCGNEYETE